MLIDCPECERSVSDKAAACPECGFPIREWIAEEAEKKKVEEAIASRARVGETDCLACKARGFVTLDREKHGQSGFTWCPVCGHSGRVILCHATDGYYAVSQTRVAAFIEGELGPEAPGIDHIGEAEPEGHLYPKPGPLVEYQDIPAWFATLLPKLLEER